MVKRQLMLGNAAIARGAYEAGVRVVSAYPGTPSTEISEVIATYKEVYAEWAPNEKAAFESAVGAAYAGARAMVCMKHVGVNVAADPMFTVAYTGINGGLVIVAADDPGMYSSQNEQDSRFYARSAHIPMLEPSDSGECKEFTKLAFELSERYDTPVFVRTTTRVAHSQSYVTAEERKELPLKPYVKNVKKYTMMPSSAVLRHIEVEKRENKFKADLAEIGVNTIEINDKSLGIICSGVVYQYVKEACPSASVLKLGVVYPVDTELVRRFAAEVKRLVVIEELEPFIEDTLKAAGVKCEGKNLFSLQGEISAALIKNKLYGEKIKTNTDYAPPRPPVLCAGCPHRGVFYILSKLKLTVSADIGCYTLGAQAPLSAVDTVLCMGASIGIAHGFEKAAGRAQSNKTVAVIGDSTFIHSGITGLINAVYNGSNITLLILDNSTTGMTGHQEHPATGKTLKGTSAKILDLEAMVKACGAESVRIVDAYDLPAVEKAVKGAIDEDGVSVVIAKRPCALLGKTRGVPYAISECKRCGMCGKIGCPAIRKNADGTMTIVAEQCAGCGVCAGLCKFGCIKKPEKNLKKT
ncbi:MAG: indolepyruvate ferredoxin oxidoreductase subunit alpha [Clostridiaceae bacterium]|jgi:indolepyruvate ferredoxin oxidoreductase alpha subunit|nr:indolepyruvate ferredoxin oxidoreductase subunit alpha [Clostridiaceae bacterium]